MCRMSNLPFSEKEHGRIVPSVNCFEFCEIEELSRTLLVTQFFLPFSDYVIFILNIKGAPTLCLHMGTREAFSKNNLHRLFFLQCNYLRSGSHDNIPNIKYKKLKTSVLWMTEYSRNKPFDLQNR